MDRSLALGFAVILSASLSAQSSATSGVDQILIQHQGELGTNSILGVQGTAFYLGEPALSVRANALPSATLRTSRFIVRGWQEGDHARVFISAIVPDSQTPNRELETPVATYAVSRNDAVRVTEMADWGAMPMILHAVRPMKR